MDEDVDGVYRLCMPGGIAAYWPLLGGAEALDADADADADAAAETGTEAMEGMLAYAGGGVSVMVIDKDRPLPLHNTCVTPYAHTRDSL